MNSGFRNGLRLLSERNNPQYSIKFQINSNNSYLKKSLSNCGLFLHDKLCVMSKLGGSKNCPKITG